MNGSDIHVLFCSPSAAFGNDLAKLITEALKNSPEAVLAHSQAPEPAEGQVTSGRPVSCEQRTIAYAGIEDLDGSRLIDGFLVLELAASPDLWHTVVEVPITPFLSPAARDRVRQFPLFRLAWYGQPGPVK